MSAEPVFEPGKSTLKLFKDQTFLLDEPRSACLDIAIIDVLSKFKYHLRK